MSSDTNQKEVKGAGGYGGKSIMDAFKSEEKVNIPDDVMKKLIEELSQALSPDRVFDEEHVRTYYRGPAHGVPRRVLCSTPPDLVVKPETREELQAVLKIASQYKIPVTPVGMQSTMMGSIPHNGGIVIDLMGLNKIHKIDLDHNYVIVEAGVTVRDVIEKIRPHDYTVAKGSYPNTFPLISTFAAWFAQHNFSNKMLDQVIGLEVCTPDGSIIRTGTMGYRETEHWTDIQASFTRLTNLFQPSQATIGVITRAAIRIWPMMDKTALPVVGFNDFGSAFRWCHDMAKSNMVDQSMVWPWVLVGGLEFSKTDRYADYIEAKMKYTQEQPPEDIGMYTCYAWAQMRGYEEEIDGAVKVAKRMAEKHGGDLLSEAYMEENMPRAWRYFKDQHRDFTYTMSDLIDGFKEAGGFSVQFSGPREELIKAYEATNEWFRKIGWKNWAYYCRMFNSGQSPWFRMMPATDAATKEEIAESVQVTNDIVNHILDQYGEKGVNVHQNLLYFNDPQNPEEVVDRVKPVRRLLRAVQKEFDPEGIMSPAMKKYTLV